MAIVAKLHGAVNVVGAEIDKKAIANAIQNCKKNNIQIPFIDLNKTSIHEKFDILIANILSNTLIQLSTTFKTLTKKKIILSGILDKQVQNVINAYSDWIILETNQKSRRMEFIGGENYSLEKYNFASAITFGDNKIVPTMVGITIKA